MKTEKTYEKMLGVYRKRVRMMTRALAQAKAAPPHSTAFKRARYRFNGSRDIAGLTVRLMLAFIDQEELNAFKAELTTLCLEMHTLESRELTRTE